MLTALLNLSAVCTLNLLLFLCRFTHSFYISVLNQDGVIFCDKFATSNDAKFYDNIEPSVFHLDELYSGNVIDEKLKKEIASYEILMPDFIATDFIINL